MCFRLRALLFENEGRTYVYWLNTLSIATRGRPVRELRPLTKRLSNYWSHTIGLETSANYRTSSSVQCCFAKPRNSRSTKAGFHSSQLQKSLATKFSSL